MTLVMYGNGKVGISPNKQLKSKSNTHADNGDELQKATDELMQASYKIAEQLYKDKGGDQAAQGENPEQADEPKKDDQGPIDTDIS